MANVKVYNMQGAAVGEISLADEVFGVEVHTSAMHAVVRAYLNAQRQGTQSAKTRTEVRGGGRKIYRQKGTVNASHMAAELRSHPRRRRFRSLSRRLEHQRPRKVRRLRCAPL